MYFTLPSQSAIIKSEGREKPSEGLIAKGFVIQERGSGQEVHMKKWFEMFEKALEEYYDTFSR